MSKKTKTKHSRAHAHSRQERRKDFLLCLLCFAFVFISKVYWWHESMQHFLPSIVYCLLWLSPFSRRSHTVNLFISDFHSLNLPSILLLVRRFCVRSLVFPRERQDRSEHPQLLNTAIERSDELIQIDSHSSWDSFQRVHQGKNALCLSLSLSQPLDFLDVELDESEINAYPFVQGWFDVLRCFLERRCRDQYEVVLISELTSFSIIWSRSVISRSSRSIFCVSSSTFLFPSSYNCEESIERDWRPRWSWQSYAFHSRSVVLTAGGDSRGKVRIFFRVLLQSERTCRRHAVRNRVRIRYLCW